MTILTSLSQEEFKDLLKETVREVLNEMVPGGNSVKKESFPEVLSVKEAARFLKLKLTTLYEKTSRKLIPHFKKGNKLYFHRPELETWIRSGRVKSQSEIEGEAITYTLNQ